MCTAPVQTAPATMGGEGKASEISGGGGLARLGRATPPHPAPRVPSGFVVFCSPYDIRVVYETTSDNKR